MDLTNSEADGWRMRSRKSCQASGAVEDPKASPPPPPSIVAGSGGAWDSAVSDQRVVDGSAEEVRGESRVAADAPGGDAAIFGFLYCRSRSVGVAEELPHRSRRVRPRKEIGRAHV